MLVRLLQMAIVVDLAQYGPFECMGNHTPTLTLEQYVQVFVNTIYRSL